MHFYFDANFFPIGLSYESHTACESAYQSKCVPNLIPTTMTKFFAYQQNNSGGVFDQLDNGSHDLIVEANTANEANKIAQEHGVYFDGCDSGVDCDCCGDRWYRQDDSDAYDTLDEIYFHKGAKIILNQLNHQGA